MSGGNGNDPVSGRSNANNNNNINGYSNSRIGTANPNGK